jgi:hypothetical protein
MRLPGFVAEASLSQVTEKGRTAIYQAKVWNSLVVSETIMAQQWPLEAGISTTRSFPSLCHLRCLDDQQTARAQCLGRCSKFVGSWSPLFTACVRTCQRGEDFYRELGIEYPGNILAAPPELRPGYCDYRCSRGARLMNFIRW